MEETIFTIKFWLKDNRPELSIDAMNSMSERIYLEVKNDIVDIEETGGRKIYVHEHLKVHHQNSAYNLVKDVFYDEFPKEFEAFKQTPIFFDINEEILLACVNDFTFSSYSQVFTESDFKDTMLRDKVANNIKKTII